RYARPVRGLSAPFNAAWAWFSRHAAIGPRSRRGRRFDAFGEGSAICFPTITVFGESYIGLGERVLIGPYCTLAAGVMPGHVLDADRVVTIGDDVLIGRGSGIVGHMSIEIGDGVFTGHNVYITDANHGYENIDLAIGKQFAPSRPVRIGAGSWLGHGSIVLPGADIGEHVVIGAGSVVAGTIPSFSVAVGNPAKVIRYYDAEQGVWRDET
ncbi:MAG: acyltransferase, partial [Acidimicrobiia bacterium]|nr:acyltransferase [Acidimicrobiia bacterium]